MIDFTAYKMNYSNGDMFTLTGSDFYGYVEYSNGISTVYETRQELTPKNSFKTDVFTSKIFFDRVVGDEVVVLPKTQDECLFSLNDEFSFESFRDKLEKIRYNNNYIFSRLFIPTGDLPSSNTITYACLTSVSDASFTTRTIGASSPSFIESTLFIYNPKFAELYNIFDATAQTNYDYEDRYTWFTVTSSASGSYFISITGSPTDIGVVEQSNYIESTENEITFGTAGGITSNSRFLFISSKSNNVIYKYDISGYLNNDSVLNNSRKLVEMMGGTGKSADKFNGLTKITCNENTLVAYDSGNRALKVYDINFNYITKINGVREEVYCMGFDPFFNNLYVITAANNIVYLYRFDECFNQFEKIELEERLAGDELPNKIEFSRNNSNFWYFATQRRVYKKLKTRPVPFIGIFNEKNLFNQTLSWTPQSTLVTNTINNFWNNTISPFAGSLYRYNSLFTGCLGETELSATGLTDNVLKGLSIFNSSADKDRIVMLSNSRLYYFYEPNEFKRVIKETNYTNYGVNGFALDRDEYIQCSSINTEIYKVVYDILTLKNNIVGRFTGSIENNYTILGDYNYNLSFEDFIDKADHEFYVQGNEKNIVGAVNRSLQKVYDLQVRLANLISVDINKIPQRQYNSSSTIEI